MTCHNLLWLGFFVSILTVVPADAGDKADPQIVKKLTEIVKIYEQQLERENLLLAEARRTAADLGELKIALCEAKINLAREIGQKVGVVELLQEILEVYQWQMKELNVLRDLGRGDALDISRVRAKILETEIRIIRARKASSF